MPRVFLLWCKVLFSSQSPLLEIEKQKAKLQITSSIGNGGINTKCAKTTNMEKCAKIKVGKIPRSNPKVKSQGQEFQECQGQTKNGKPEKTGKNRKKPEKTGKNRKNGKWENGKV